MKDRKIEWIHSDGGGEYHSKSFESFCETLVSEKHILLLIRSTTAKLNGSIGPCSKTCRSLHLSTRLPHSLWAEALETAYYLKIRTPCKKLNGETPFAIWKWNRLLQIKNVGLQSVCQNSYSHQQNSKEGYNICLHWLSGKLPWGIQINHSHLESNNSQRRILHENDLFLEGFENKTQMRFNLFFLTKTSRYGSISWSRRDQK